MHQINRKTLLYGLPVIVVLIGLCIGLISSPTASAQTRQINPNDIVTNSFSGTATGWTDNSLFPGPASQTISATIDYDSTTGAVTTFSFPPFQLTDPSTHVTITVSIPSGATPTGQFDVATGAFSVTTPLELQGVPIIGTVTTNPITLSTSNSITPPGGNTFTGSPVDASGNVTVVGQTSFNKIISANVWVRIVGVVQPAS